jgi:hypothetical protein
MGNGFVALETSVLNGTKSSVSALMRASKKGRNQDGVHLVLFGLGEGNQGHCGKYTHG